jgi:hypothetical protein
MEKKRRIAATQNRNSWIRGLEEKIGMNLIIEFVTDIIVDEVKTTTKRLRKKILSLIMVCGF